MQISYWLGDSNELTHIGDSSNSILLAEVDF